MNILRNILVWGLYLFVPGTAFATETASPWAQSHSTSMRLIAGTSQNSTHLRAGIEIKLDPHFKTYWRNPGESGVAPVINFAGSENLADAEVRFPAPELFKDKSGTTIGYKNHVIWPVWVKAQDPAKPVWLKLKLDYGVCEKICIPASATAQLTLSAKTPSEFENDIIAAEALVPRLAKLNVALPLKPDGLMVKSVTEPKLINNRPVFDVEVYDSNPLTQLLAEAKPDSWFLEVLEPRVQPNGRTLFSITVFDPQTGRNHIPCDIQLTVLGKKEAIEVPVQVKGCIEKP